MGNKFYISDTHFGHAGTWERFKNPDGTPLRPFTSTEEMDEKMIENWNSVVKEHDTVYHCGDVVIGKKHLEKIRRLNGKKKLIMGNHDIFKIPAYQEAGFYDFGLYLKSP
jgi:calcineurin-like phosphoesterase family protein